MRIDLPLCNFKLCKKQFDGNCTGTENNKEDCEQFKNPWIHAKEALPNKDDYYITAWRGYHMAEPVGRFLRFSNGRFEIDGVILWMEMPKLPKLIREGLGGVFDE